jgi:Ca2+-binding RTX toxin-like protein
MASQATASSEMLVNTHTALNQQYPSIAALLDGGWVVTWTSFGQGGAGAGVYQQRYAADGTTVGSETLLAATMNVSEQYYSSVTGLAGGGWVVTWMAFDGASTGVFQRVYDSSGVATGPEVQVSVTTAGPQGYPSVTALADGGWVVVWDSSPGGANGLDIYQRRYAADGSPGAETLVNTTTAGPHRDASVTVLGDGGWVVTWTDGAEIYQQRYEADGDPLGGETLVNTTTDAHDLPSVAALIDGGWIVTWQSSVGGVNDVHQQRYDEDGLPVGGEVLVNSATDNQQQAPTVTGLADGGWVVTWTSNLQDGDSWGIYQQRYGSDGAPVGDETLVAVTTAGTQDSPVVTALADGSWVVAWRTHTNGSDSDVHQRHFARDIVGDGADNSIAGTTWGELIDGGTGKDTLNGGKGDDVYVVDQGDDIIVEASGEGTDTVRSSVTYALGTYLENLTLTGSGNIHGIGNGLANTIVGTTGNNSLSGGADDDHLTGGDGNDTLDGGTGSDWMNGGASNDTYVVDAISDTVVPDVSGTDIVVSSVNFSLASVTGIEHLTLTGTAASAIGNGAANVVTGNGEDNSLAGSGGNDTLFGGDGGDTLDGGTGNDSLEGGDGDDYYVIDGSGDVLSEDADEGDDTVESSISFVLGANLENLVLTGSANLAGTGNGDDNGLTGNAGNNTLLGGGGDDFLEGGDGNDSLDGGAGSDGLAGGAGNDTLRSGDAAEDYTRFLGGDGVDLAIIDRASHTRSFVVDIGDPGGSVAHSDIEIAGIERLDFTAGSGNDNITGGALADRITGNAGRDLLAGGGGADTMTGGDGVDIVSGDAGNDSLSGGGGIGIVDGGSGDDRVSGDSGNDSLDGGAGDDTIDGGRGYDVMAGGLGDDLYIVDRTRDTVFEDVGEGTDTVRANASFSLDDDIEHLELTGSANIRGYGNAQANRLTGNVGNNSLEGGSGNDTLIGGAGTDTLSGGSGRDYFVFNAIADSRAKASTADRIADFKHGRDHIDLHLIDANLSRAGDQAFVFDRKGTSDTHVAKGHIGWYQVDAAGKANDATYLRINNDGDRAIDMVIRLDGLVSLTKGDFVL